MPTLLKVLALPVTLPAMFVVALYRALESFACGVWTRLVLISRGEW